MFITSHVQVLKCWKFLLLNESKHVQMNVLLEGVVNCVYKDCDLVVFLCNTVT